MPTTNLQPQTTTNPDQGGTSAVTSASNTGHGSTQTRSLASADAEGSDLESVSKSCRWSAFQSPPFGTITSLRLQFNYSISGTLTSLASSGGSATGSAEFLVQYTLNGGSNWTTVATDSAVVSGNDTDAVSASGSADVALSTSQTISQVQVRALYETSADVTGGPVDGSSADIQITATIDTIHLEAVTAAVSPGLIVAM